MRATIVLALCLAAVAAAVPSNPQRIVGGSVTTIDQYPSIVALLWSASTNFRQACGGIIINSRSILTAAHCTHRDAPIRWRTRVGSTWANSGGIVHNTASILVHPYYRPGIEDNDVSIMQSATVIGHNNNARPGSFAGANYNLGDNQVVWAAGWGRLYSGGPLSEQLRHVQVWSVNQDVCAQRYRTIGDTITANMLCSGWLDVGGRDQCQGDSGGPVYHNGVVVGVTSWGRGCALAFFPGVNARVSRFISWIQSNA